jgi:prepilin-type N-terminal cleavage/methylation domain-containing protein
MRSRFTASAQMANLETTPLDCHLETKHAPEDKTRGFTLAELLVALAIMGMLTMLAMPSLARFGDRMTFALGRQDIEWQIDQLPQIALGQGRDIVLGSSEIADGTYPVTVPKGWNVNVDAPIHYRFDGVCSGGRVLIKLGSFQKSYRLAPPLCALRAN